MKINTICENDNKFDVTAIFVMEFLITLKPEARWDYFMIVANGVLRYQ
jgi:hypothetical protein